MCVGILVVPYTLSGNFLIEVTSSILLDSRTGSPINDK